MQVVLIGTREFKSCRQIFPVEKHDGPVSILYFPAAVREFTLEQVCNAEYLVAADRMCEYLSKAERPTLIVVQLMDSPASFPKRYPEKFRIFDDVQDPGSKDFPAKQQGKSTDTIIPFTILIICRVKSFQVKKVNWKVFRNSETIAFQKSSGILFVFSAGNSSFQTNFYLKKMCFEVILL